MKLHRMKVNRFRALQHGEVSFEDQLGRVRPLTVMAGPNGCGKTSVLFAIVQTLRYVMRYNTTDVPEPTEADIFRSGELMGLSREPPEASVVLNLSFEKAELSAIAQVFKDAGEPTDRIDAFSSTNGDVEAEWAYPPRRKPDGTRQPPNFLRACHPAKALDAFRGRSLAKSLWRERALSSRKLLDEIGDLFLFPQDRNLRARVTGDAIASENRSDADGNQNFVEEHRKPREPISIWGILEYLSGYARSRFHELSDEENWEKRIQEHFNSICYPKQYLGFLYEEDDPNGAPYFRDGDSVYPLHMAASGEQVIIEYITRLTYPSPMNHSLILIDEPEVHLHPGWIRQLYRALPSIGSDNQYIVTTHSLELRKLAAEDGTLIDMGEMGDKL